MLDAATPEWCRKYLLNETKASATRYQAAAAELAAEFQRLHALGELLAVHGFGDLRPFVRPAGGVSKCGRLEVPRLTDTVYATVPPAPAGMAHADVGHAWLFTAGPGRDRLASLVAAELEHARGQGVALLGA